MLDMILSQPTQVSTALISEGGKGTHYSFEQNCFGKLKANEEKSPVVTGIIFHRRASL